MCYYGSYILALIYALMSPELKSNYQGLGACKLFAVVKHLTHIGQTEALLQTISSSDWLYCYFRSFECYAGEREGKRMWLIKEFQFTELYSFTVENITHDISIAIEKNDLIFSFFGVN